MGAIVICSDGNVTYDSVETLRKLSTILEELLVDTCCRAVIILADCDTSHWYKNYVKSEIEGLVSGTNPLVDPQTGVLQVSNMIIIVLN